MPFLKHGSFYFKKFYTVNISEITPIFTKTFRVFRSNIAYFALVFVFMILQFTVKVKENKNKSKEEDF